MIRIISLELIGYKAIFNGMFRDSIFIDFSNFKNKITLLKGPSGIGKSTIQEALSILPESNNSFIDGVYAEKKFHFININSREEYLSQFIHGVKSNGQRESVKAYLFKSIDGQMINLNPNGNLSSYKTIIENEFEIDLGFLIFSRITNENKGLVEKTPSERRKCINVLLKNTDIYNEINKKSSALFNQYKGIISSITGKLDKLHDKSTMIDLVNKYESDILIKKNTLSQLNIKYGEIQANIKNIDPNNDIMDKYNNIINEISKIDSKNISEFDYEVSISKLNSLHDKILSLEKDKIKNDGDILLHSTRIDDLIKNRNDKLDNILSLKSKLDKFNLTDKDKLINRKNELVNSINNKQIIINEMGIININDISSEEYLTCIRTIQDIESLTQDFMSKFSLEIIDTSIEYFIKDIRISTTELSNKLSLIMDNISEVDKNISDSINKESIVEILTKRPSDCKNDLCPFIKNAVDIMNDNFKSSEYYINIKEDLISEMNNITNEINRQESIKNAMNELNNIRTYINANRNILNKIKHISNSFILNIKEFIKNIKDYNFNEVRDIYKFIQDINIIEEYKNNIKEIEVIDNQINDYNNKEDIINELLNDISKLENDINKINDDINSLDKIKNDSIKYNELILTELNDIEYNIKNIEENISLLSNKDKLEKEYNSIKDNILKLKSLQEESMNIINNINLIQMDLEPMENELNSLKISLKEYDSYISELEMYNKDYEIISLIKKYSNPTGIGIQTIFMKYYMNSIIDSSNEFLQYFFNGEFMLLHDNGENPNEFKIPCKGNGILHDDISSMSFSQRCIVSMIISISLYRKASNIYNLLLLDEIDSGLDSEQRRIFARNIDSISDILGISHIIITSHNNEFNESYCDIIDLTAFKQ